MPIPDGHLSASRMNMLMHCSMQYYFRYCEELTIPPPSAALGLGSAFHHSIAIDYAQKIKSHENLPLEQVLAGFSDDWEERKHEIAWWEDEEPGKFKDQGVNLLSVYREDIAINIQPASVEKEFEIHFQNKEWTFIGRVDLIDDKDTMIETKTIRSKPSRPQSDHLLQTVGYCTGFRAENSDGLHESGARIDYAVKNQKPIMVSYPFKVQDSQVEFFLSQVARVAEIIEQEMFLPNRTYRLCSHKFCGYATRCEQICGGIVQEK